GYLHERGSGKGRGYNLNLPLPEGINDSEFLYVLEGALPVVLEIFKPEVYVLQLGTDSLEEDYLSKFKLSNWGFLKAFDTVRDMLGNGIYLGGGGYHPIALARAWSLVWCRLTDRDVPTFLNDGAKKVLFSVDFEEFDEDTDKGYMFQTLLDKPREGQVRKEVKELLEKALNYYK
ncbi:MAG: acetoin utilization protein AcuC, partial [Aquificaceae bacterium]|nr:acetoin utilization protein AcuC [Aquificaceae bacterium]